MNKNELEKVPDGGRGGVYSLHNSGRSQPHKFSKNKKSLLPLRLPNNPENNKYIKWGNSSMNIPIYILSDDNRWMIRTFGEVRLVETLMGMRDLYRVHLANTVETEGNKIYRIEIPSAKVIFRGWLSKDGKTIIQV